MHARGLCVREVGRGPVGTGATTAPREGAGEAGPLHAATVAGKLGIKEIIIPAASGTASALGFLGSPISYSVTKSKPIYFNEFDVSAIEDLLQKMAEEKKREEEQKLDKLPVGPFDMPLDAVLGPAGIEEFGSSRNL